MLLKYKNKEMEVPEDFLILCGQHAAERGMSLEEYIAEAFTMLEQRQQVAWSYDANGSPVEE